MDNATTLERVQSGYRMPRPTALSGAECPVRMYEMMVKCWDKRPEQRPTFAYLREFFDDYATETEGQYQQQDWTDIFTALHSIDRPVLYMYFAASPGGLVLWVMHKCV